MEILDVRNKLAKHARKQYSKRSLQDIKYLAIHHSGTKSGDAFSFAHYHVNENDWPGIGYHYVILKDGTIQWVNDLETVSYHVRDYNSKAVGICLVGDFRSDYLSEQQKTALIELCQFLMMKLSLNPLSIQGHSELAKGKTECPAIDMDELREQLGKNHVEIYLDKKKLDVLGIVEHGITYVAIRPILEQLGYEVIWDGELRRVYLKKG